MKVIGKSGAIIRLLGLLTAVTISSGAVHANASSTVIGEDPEGRAMLQQAEQLIAAYHAGHPQANHTLRVVYFVPKDGTPLANYTERLDRIMNDVSNFYRDGFRRLGIENSGLPLERKDGKLVVHLVQGQLPASEYHYDSGDRTRQEIGRALQGTMDIGREQVLVLYALCRKERDGRYVFDAPYYGDRGSSQRSGLCHAADCELLDPPWLTNTNRKMVFTEHYYARREMTVAQFNSWYLGGIAHELGHGLGLPHDNGGGDEKAFGVSLMGQGNLTYRQELWGGGPPTYLGRASVLQLAAHPLFTGSERGRWDDAKSAFASLEFSATNKTLKIQGVVTTGAIPPYAVIAYLWPVSDRIDDHSARTYPCVPQNGGFTLKLDGLRQGEWHLVLSRLHVNGAASAQELRLRCDKSSAPDVIALNEEWMVDSAENAVMRQAPDARILVGDAAIAAAPTAEAARKLRLLRTVLNPLPPFDLTSAPEKSVFLSDATWTDASVGWGKVARNYFWFDENIQNGVLLKLKGQFYDKGLYAHSPARFVFPTAAQWKTFTASIGLQDGANVQGSAVFRVRGDGRELYRSRILRVGQREQVKVDISRVKELELLTDGGEGHNHNSWAVWAEPELQR